MPSTHATRWITDDLLEAAGYSAAGLPVRGGVPDQHHVPGRPHRQADVHGPATGSERLPRRLDLQRVQIQWPRLRPCAGHALGRLRAGAADHDHGDDGAGSRLGLLADDAARISEGGC